MVRHTFTGACEHYLWPLASAGGLWWRRYRHPLCVFHHYECCQPDEQRTAHSHVHNAYVSPRLLFDNAARHLRSFIENGTAGCHLSELLECSNIDLLMFFFRLKPLRSFSLGEALIRSIIPLSYNSLALLRSGLRSTLLMLYLRFRVEYDVHIIDLM